MSFLYMRIRIVHHYADLAEYFFSFCCQGAHQINLLSKWPKYAVVVRSSAHSNKQCFVNNRAFLLFDSHIRTFPHKPETFFYAYLSTSFLYIFNLKRIIYILKRIRNHIYMYYYNAY